MRYLMLDNRARGIVQPLIIEDETFEAMFSEDDQAELSQGFVVEWGVLFVCDMVAVAKDELAACRAR